MRTVLKSTNEVAHFWANKVQSEGRASNLFFDGEYIFSYGRHFCIARHLPSGKVAMTTRRYSATTSAHVSQVRSAANHLHIVYCRDPLGTAAENMRYARNDVVDALATAEKPRLHAKTRDGHKARALHLAEQANAYLAALSVEARGDVQPIDVSNLQGARDALIKEQAEKQARIAAQKKAREADDLLMLGKWRSHDPVVAYGNLRNLPVALRLTPQAVETSYGAEIPLADAKKLWPVIQRVMHEHAEYEPGQPIGSYRLTKIRTDGSIVVGCHDIPFIEIKHIAAQLGLS